MGNGKSKSTMLKDTELNEFKNLTSFSNEIVIKLHNHYKHFSSVQIDDGVIDYSEFCALISRQNELTKRIFNSIDINKDGVINFREFIKFISIFINGSLEEQIKLSFNISFICSFFKFKFKNSILLGISFLSFLKLINLLLIKLSF